MEKNKKIPSREFFFKFGMLAINEPLPDRTHIQGYDIIYFFPEYLI